jgi:uncharacterized protein YjcR
LGRRIKRSVPKKTAERSDKNTERSDHNVGRSERVSTLNKAQNGTRGKKPENTGKKTNTNTRPGNARPGNRNARGNKGGVGGPKGNRHAAGNKGGIGGPVRNKHALRTGEFETIFFDEIISEKEKALLEADYDKYALQYLLIDTLTMREKRILARIKQIEETLGGMVFDAVTKTKGEQTTRFKNRNKDGDEWDGNEMILGQDNSTHRVKPVIKRVMELEDALTRVQARKQNAIAQLHRMEMDDERLSIDHERLDLYKQRISGQIDLDALIGDDDWEQDLEDDIR